MAIERIHDAIKGKTEDDYASLCYEIFDLVDHISTVRKATEELNFPS